MAFVESGEVGPAPPTERGTGCGVIGRGNLLSVWDGVFPYADTLHVGRL